MAEPNPLVTSPPSEPEVYRPIAPLAVVGLCVGGFYCGLVVITTLVALFRGAPFFLPAWTILLWLGGALISGLAVGQIANSERTRAGAALARWGLLLALVSGAAYTAYTYFTGLALKQQANAFLLTAGDDDSGFFPRLIDGAPAEFNRAFLLTMPYGRRLGHDPRNLARMARDFEAGGPSGGEGELSMFRDHQFVRSIAGSKATTVEPLGVQDWKFEQGSYQVIRNYKVSMPEMTFEVQVPTYSTEGDDSEGRRKWFVAFRNVQLGKPQWTELGGKLLEARISSRGLAQGLIAEANKNVLGLGDTTDYERVFPKDFPIEALKKLMPGILAGTDRTTRKSGSPIEDAPLAWEQLGDGRLRLAHDYNLMVEAVPDFPTVQFKARLRFWVETEAPFDVMTAQVAPKWQATRFEIIHVTPPPRMMKKEGSFLR